jgi:hypothetical protein
MTSAPIENSGNARPDLAEQNHRSDVLIAKILISVWGAIMLLALGWVAWVNP